jgi:hypothetical protein
MRRRKVSVAVLPVLVLVLVLGVFGGEALAQGEGWRWYKGNTHSHTLNSDGDSVPDQVARWYREQRYHFLVLSDHDYLTKVDHLNRTVGAEGRFLLIPGVEVSDRFEDKPVHINALGLKEVVLPTRGKDVPDTLQNNVKAIRNAGGIPHINHPNFNWAITAEDLLKVEGWNLFEIFNGHPGVHNHGGGGAPSMEQMWDQVLTAGKKVYGIASDDSHHFRGEFHADRANPGRGWIMVRAPELSESAILKAIEEGDFYASTGVTLNRYEVTARGIELDVRVVPSYKYTIEFIGEGGRVLGMSYETPASYPFSGNEKYVRAKVTDSGGRVAWAQPVFPGRE